MKSSELPIVVAFLLIFMTWKTVIIDKECVVSLSLNTLKVKVDDDYIKVPIGDLQTVIFSHECTTITIPILTALVANNVGVIISDKRKDPMGVFLPFNGHSLVFKQLNSQINWKLTRKKKLWKLIIESKINGQYKLLDYLDADQVVVERLKELSMDVKSDDSSNREALGAKLYFNQIFGNDFVRHTDTTINFALDYGYKILASYISRFIASRGYLVQCGIHHIGSSNPFNLTYDFIEPFRVFVDYFVLNTIEFDESFKMQHRHELVNMLNYKVMIESKKQRLSKAIDLVIDSYFAFLLEKNDKVIVPEYTKFYLFNDTE
ncbi:MAG: type II CRISPR-associated endonuclease Cas1 [Erysipelotrichaceae bacterium]